MMAQTTMTLGSGNEIVALVGQNGSGKSTLVKVLTDPTRETPALA